MKVPYIPDTYTPAITIENYRALTSDNTSPDELVIKRIFYIERLCRGVIQQELRNAYENK
jgi:hypothetical protein